MNKERKLNYYNNFLLLSLGLIAGYFFVSLYFLNRTWKSGKQAEEYGAVVEKTNAIIQYTSQLENAAYSFLLTQSKESAAIYKHKKIRLLDHFETLHQHCTEHHYAKSETEDLHQLIDQRIAMFDAMMARDFFERKLNKEHVIKGDQNTKQIIGALKRIKKINVKRRALNQDEANIANRNAMILLTSFGGLMLLIVFISFFKMRKEILKSNRFLREIKEINLELNAVNENLESYAYVASHDLGEPLRKIQAFGDLVTSELQNENADLELVKSHISRMQSASQRMQELIEALLAYSRISIPKEIHQSIDLNDTIDKVLSDLSVSIQENNVLIERSGIPTEIIADEVQMRQLFQNLISNAIKFRKTEGKPQISISGEIVNAKNISLKALENTKQNQFYKISVQDNGIGFDPKYADKIFTVFQRLHGRSAYEGTGIGLSICKKIVENHQGAISVISAEGNGATFIIYLPVKQ